MFSYISYLLLGIFSLIFGVFLVLQACEVCLTDNNVWARNRRAAILARKNNIGYELSEDENIKVDEFCKMGVLETTPVYEIIKDEVYIRRYLKLTRQALHGEV